MALNALKGLVTVGGTVTEGLSALLKRGAWQPLGGRFGSEVGSVGRDLVMPSPGQISAVSRTAAQGGREAVQHFLRKQLESLPEHEAKLMRYRAEGGYTSAVEKTIRNVKGLIEAARQWLGENP